MIMDPFTKKVLWDFWIIKDGQEGFANKEFFDVEKANNDYEQETTEICRIETNLFDYETPLCTKFNKFNFLLKVDPELFTHDIERTKTYEYYENKLNDELEEPWSEDGDYEWYNKLADGNLKEEALKQKAIYEKSWGDASQNEERCELFDDQERPVCNIRRFEMIKYSFGEDEEYVAIKEHEYDDLTKSTNEDACRTYQEIFRMMDGGWMVTRAE
ncbi:hypothetical protein Tco_1098774 [Tanacetum coccineum]